jgi:serine/threonine protein kinase
MSPEQVLNKPVDIRSDIYSLGITLYEMLTAHVPFEGDSEYQIMSHHVSTVPPPPTRFYPYIPKGVESGSSQGNQAQQVGSTQTPQAPSVDSAEISKLQDELDQLSSRARAAKDTVENIRRQQNAQGLNLRGDIAAAEDRMGTDIDKAQGALQNQNAKDAQRYIDKAEAEVETLEKFLGRRSRPSYYWRSRSPVALEARLTTFRDRGCAP